MSRGVESVGRAGTGVATPRCRQCGSALDKTFADLGKSPLCETYLAPQELNRTEPFYPLHVWVCETCWLVQLEAYVAPDEIFGHYPYFSSYSTSWVEHARRFADAMIDRLDLGRGQRVVEVGSNDGYLLQHFAERQIGVLGVEPAGNVAEAARERGIETRVEFFGVAAAQGLVDEGLGADLLVGNNVLAQVPDLHDFVEGLRLLLADKGVLSLEFPHLQRTVEGNQFDQIYHEHFSYFSLLSVEAVLAEHRLAVVDVEELSTHGGSLRVLAVHADRLRADPSLASQNVERVREAEAQAGMTTLAWYEAFQPRIDATKRNLLRFLIDAKERGESIAGYGAPGKGNTLLNFCGIGTDFLDYTVDRNPYKQGRFTPGTHIPIHAPDRIAETRPANVLILPWNLVDEIQRQLSYVGEWGGRFVVAIPEVTTSKAAGDRR